MFTLYFDTRDGSDELYCSGEREGDNQRKFAGVMTKPDTEGSLGV